LGTMPAGVPYLPSQKLGSFLERQIALPCEA
jgi:hypothetical protein